MPSTLAWHKFTAAVLRVVNTIPFVLISAVIVWSYYAFVLNLCLYLWNVHRVQAILYLVAHHILFLLFTWSYCRASFTPPGSPQDAKFNPSVDQESLLPTATTIPVDHPIALEPVLVKRDGRPRFCKKCQGSKPDRAHHCRVCGRCILKMDHHCPWLNNCVGFANYKFFYLFILHGAIYCLWCCIATIFPCWEVILDPTIGLLNLSIHWILMVFLGFALGVGLIGFTAFHTRLLLANRTTIESFERTNYRVGHTSEVTRSRYLNLFDIGWRQNWVQVMGPRWWLWLLPVYTTLGDGRKFPLCKYGYQTVNGSEEDIAGMSA
ncbi:uncharacterized protein VTP21DRAFT_5354 [Calcarisporiella thermophila]|uniref:uncharacterized protein n=1 Tax=Calcarisporiella thermophila TaxID=911321 RepID=UPI0037445E98